MYSAENPIHRVKPVAFGLKLVLMCCDYLGADGGDGPHRFQRTPREPHTCVASPRQSALDSPYSR